MKKILATVAIMATVIIPSSAARWECIRWTWTGDVYSRKVVCLEWRDKAATIVEKKK